MKHSNLVNGPYLKERSFASTKWFGLYQDQTSRFMAQDIVLVIITGRQKAVGYMIWKL